MHRILLHAKGSLMTMKDGKPCLFLNVDMVIWRDTGEDIQRSLFNHFYDLLSRNRYVCLSHKSDYTVITMLFLATYVALFCGIVTKL